jgi:3-hydroxybutyryl-CoA dehydrogenase
MCPVVISGLQTSPATLATTLSLSARMEKITTRSRDTPGFIANRLLMPYLNEAIFALQEVRKGSREEGVA